ncbi:hypothetical protein BIU88_06495 [Chlorobaculum limnaeum]|uniref:Schlafen group 3-like DNA/RNA helicase domain-containing protein n=1 Tax=Chlorobaculum limnaeum TaxID=274537 RepID=A0A1D8D6L2_CHLLM|nr:DUF2075 domain-containing protein [Chlorobaculum limnaeum]AOS83828.1 hypothetical protein BIU88_06495 [Chlorobaculum limnaeum]
MNRSWYNASFDLFQQTSDEQIIGELALNSTFADLPTQKIAWLKEISILRKALQGHDGCLHLEFNIPRMGRRIDAVLLIKGIVIAIEFKIDASQYLMADIDQSYDYALDLKYFHEASHKATVIPVLVVTKARSASTTLFRHPRIHGLYEPVSTNEDGFASTLEKILHQFPEIPFDPQVWSDAAYRPTQTIIEAARALYAGHGVVEISRNDAGAINLSQTSDQLFRIIDRARDQKEKAICFVTGVPGAGKTLVGLNIATRYSDEESELYSVFLSGNKPLVDILREALARDTILREKMSHGKKLKKSEAQARVKAFIQNVHHFRDDCQKNNGQEPVEHVALFDEAQRAWDKAQTSLFMKQIKGVPDFDISEPEYLISCMDKRNDWAVIVCLVGGGQEINTGESGISSWIEALQEQYPDWHLYISPALTDSEYGTGNILSSIRTRKNVHFEHDLHLATSMRSFRAETVSKFVKTVLDCEVDEARTLYQQLIERYPIVLTRNLESAKQWLKTQASGSERYGMVVSSQAERLKPYAIDVRSPMNPIKWFLDSKDDIRSSYYLEDVATEFRIQGLELDWVCVSWDGDFRYGNQGWEHYSFRGNKWQNIKSESRKTYQKNAYRVLLTRARQGMVIFVPEGTPNDPTRIPRFYDNTYKYLKSLGVQEIG